MIDTQFITTNHPHHTSFDLTSLETELVDFILHDLELLCPGQQAEGLA